MLLESTFSTFKEVCVRCVPLKIARQRLSSITVLILCPATLPPVDEVVVIGESLSDLVWPAFVEQIPAMIAHAQRFTELLSSITFRLGWVLVGVSAAFVVVLHPFLAIHRWLKIKFTPKDPETIVELFFFCFLHSLSPEASSFFVSLEPKRVSFCRCAC